MFKLTQLSRSSGCGCKISPDKLESILQRSPTPAREFPNLLVGNESRDDAAVLQFENGNAMVSTVDFFTPVSDDPYEFGEIAAANSLSDVYAMGASPLMALAILGWNSEKIQPEVIRFIMMGAEAKCNEAGIPLAGGHSIDSMELFFGLAVTGTAPASNIKKNSTAKNGDILFITKPLGSGIISAAAKRDEVIKEDYFRMITVMKQLNSIGSALGKMIDVHALTDITGFGLLGHLAEMCRGSNCSAEIYFNRIPLIADLSFYTQKLIYPDMTMKVFASLSRELSELSPAQIFTLCDPQTNGGLLISVSERAEKEIIRMMADYKIEQQCLVPIGKLIPRGKMLIQVLQES